MKISIDQVIRDFLALRGESPELLPELAEGEESAVLTLARELRAKIPAAAVKATLETPHLFLDEIRSVVSDFTVVSGNCGLQRMPPDYLRLYSLQMADWKEPLRAVEPDGTLRSELGARAPQWMICHERPMVKEQRDTEGICLKVYGSEAFDLPATVFYIPFPEFDGQWLTISRGAYYIMLRSIIDNG